MNFPARRKPLALLLCYGFAGVVAGTQAADALAQAPAPLRVDPVLLGLPPVTPAEAPAPAAVVPAPVPQEAARVEIKPVDQPAVEARTDADAQANENDDELRKRAQSVKATPKPTPQESTKTVQPPADVQVKQAPSSPSPIPAPAPSPAAVLPVAPVPESTRRDVQTTNAPSSERSNIKEATVGSAATVQPQAARPAAPKTAVVAPVAIAPTASAPSAAGQVASLAPLRVDPTLLGQPPAPTHVTAAPSSNARVAPNTSTASAGDRAAPVVLAANTQASRSRVRSSDKSWLSSLWDPIANAYDNGSTNVYLPLKTYHSRKTYSSEQIESYQENPVGFGIGRGLYNENGNWDGVFAMAFQDSHFKPSYTAGYEWQAIWRPTDNTRVGLGYLAGLMSRSDYIHYVPFPVVLPVASLAYKNFSLEGAYVPPGGKNGGNVFFLWAKWDFGKPGEAIGTPARPAEPEPTQFANNTRFGTATPLADQRVPYGPALDTGTRLASGSETVPPQVAAMGPRDEEEVPDVTPALALRSAKKMETLSSSDPEPRPVFLSAQRMGGTVDREFVAEGDAQLRKIGTVLEADRMTYWPVDDEVEAEGRAHLEQGDDQMNGPKMRLKLQDQVGYFDQPSYTIKRQPPAKDNAAEERLAELAEKTGGDWLNSGFESPRMNVKPGQSRFSDSTKKTRSATEGRGDADRLDFEGKNQFRLTNASYTTCKPDNDDWYAKASEIKLDYDREVGDAKDATVYFKDVPILYSPWLSFSLNNQRKSGFLAPSFGTSTDSGIEIAVPYYWNIAPNMDATITPRAMSKRGVMVNNEVRYLNTAFGGLYRDQLRLEYLPNDNLRDGKNRYGFSLQHTQSTDNGFSARINYNKVSDDNYYTDLSSGISSTSTTQLSQQGLFSYHGGGWWNASANFQQYQTLQPDPENPVREPYRMLPQLTLNARKPDWLGTDSSFLGQFTRFTRPDQVIKGTNYDGDSGQRTVLYPQVAIPFVTPGWYVTPKLGVNIRHYNLSGQAAGTPSSINTTLPIASIDSGMFFERQSNWFGRDYTQTLEPRLYYLNIPFKDQSDIPRFDTELADFNFAQMFSENQFTSWDRINSANQLTAAVTTRLLEPQTGNEIMRATLGQRIYFSPNRVGLDSTFNKTDKWDRSDILAAFSGQVLPKVYADAAWQYNLADRQVKRYSMGAHYRPEPGKVLNATYRYNRDASAPVDQIDLSAQWPLSGRWYAVGRLNYSFKDDKTDLNNTRQGGRMIESIAGLEYNAGCWAIRGVIKRTALTEDKASSSFFIQLELTDFGQIGSNPLNLLKRNIQGYSPINASESDADLGD